MVLIAVIPFTFLCGISSRFSVRFVKILLGLDVRKFGDGNPRAFNAFRTGNKSVGLLVLLLDISKAAAPVGWAYFNLDIHKIPMLLIAVAPILGCFLPPSSVSGAEKRFATSWAYGWGRRFLEALFSRSSWGIVGVSLC